MRRQLRSARLAQEKYEQNRKELIAGISHDLSTPLTLLKGYASGILVGIAKTAEKRHHYVELIYQNACTLENSSTGCSSFPNSTWAKYPL